jgi:hypothetical protein
MNAPPQMLAPSQAAISASSDLVFEAIIENADLAASYAISVREAAWRGDTSLLGMHLAQLRLATIAAIKTYKEEIERPPGRDK